jgi:cell division septum initiation protein DivIVA
VALVTHLLKKVINRSIIRQQVVVTLTKLIREIEVKQQEVDTLTTEVDTLTGKAETLRSKLNTLRQEKQQLNNKRPKGAKTSAATIDRARTILRQRVEDRLPVPSGAELGRLLGVSKTTGNNLKKQLLPEFTEVNPNGNYPGEKVAA